MITRSQAHDQEMAAAEQQQPAQVDYSMYNSLAGRYAIIRTIGSGHFGKVKLAVDTQTGQQVAVKIMRFVNNEQLMDEKQFEEQQREILMKECHALENLNHANLLRVLDFQQAQYKKKSGAQWVFYVVYELIEGAELFDFISLSGTFSESIARYFFHQLMSALKHCYEAGICHRDLKPENLMIDGSCNLKVVDFGFATGLDPTGLTTQLGTPGYQAPEIIYGFQYEGINVDLFAATVILFMMVTGCPPFIEAKKDDPYFNRLIFGKHEEFWKIHTQDKQNGADFFSPEFRDLIEKIFVLSPDKRLSFEEVLEHPWMNCPIPDHQQIVYEFKQRKTQIIQQQEVNRTQIELKKQKRLAERNSDSNQQMMGGDNQPYHLSKSIETYHHSKRGGTFYFTTCHPDMIEQDLAKFLLETGQEALVNEVKYKMLFEVPVKANKAVEGLEIQTEHGKKVYQEKEERTVEMCLRIYKVRGEQQLYCVEFIKVSGVISQFYEAYNEIMRECLAYSIEPEPPKEKRT